MTIANVADTDIAAGCRLLERGLQTLERQIQVLRATMSSLDREAPGARPKWVTAKVDAAFGSAATYVADTLADVSARLGRLDAVLNAMEKQQRPPTAAARRVGTKRTPPRRASRRAP